MFEKEPDLEGYDKEQIKQLKEKFLKSEGGLFNLNKLLEDTVLILGGDHKSNEVTLY